MNLKPSEDTTSRLSNESYSFQPTELTKVHTTNSYENASSNNFPSTLKSRVHKSTSPRLRPTLGSDLPKWDGHAGLRAGGARTTPHLPTPPPSLTSDGPKRARLDSPGTEKARKKQKHQQHSSQACYASQARPQHRPPPPTPPPLPQGLTPTYQDFLLCARFRTPLVKPSPVFTPLRLPPPRQAQPTPVIFAPVASSSRFPKRSPSTLTLANSSSSASSLPFPALPDLALTTNESHNNFSPTDWEFLRPPLKDRSHLSEDEFYASSDHDEWANEADPHYHDIKGFNDWSDEEEAEGEGEGEREAGDSDDFRARRFEPWRWIEQRLKYKMNRDNNGQGEEGMLPNGWGLGAMRKAEARERFEREERKRRKAERRRENAISAKGEDQSRGDFKGKGKEKEERVDGDEGDDQGTDEQQPELSNENPRNRRQSPFIPRLKKYYDIDEPFTDDSDIERELQDQPAVGLAALAIPLIRKERDRRKQRRRDGKEDQDTTDDEAG